MLGIGSELDDSFFGWLSRETKPQYYLMLLSVLELLLVLSSDPMQTNVAYTCSSS